MAIIHCSPNAKPKITIFKWLLKSQKLNKFTMNMFAKNSAKSIEEYFMLVPKERKATFEFLHSFIQNTVPNLKPYYASNMIGYGSFFYLDSKKQKKDWPIIALANQKNYIAIYVCALIKDKEAVENYKKDLGKLTTSLSCIRFKELDEINLNTLATVLKLAEKYPGVAGARLVE